MAMQDLITVWMVGMGAGNVPALGACQPEELLAFIGGAPASHNHDMSQIAGISEALTDIASSVSAVASQASDHGSRLTSLEDSMASLAARVAAIEAQLSSGGFTYSPAVNQFLQSQDAPAMRQAIGLVENDMGAFGMALSETETLQDALVLLSSSFN